MKINNWVFVPPLTVVGTPLVLRALFFLCGVRWSTEGGEFALFFSLCATIVAVVVSAVGSSSISLGHTDLSKLWGWWK